MPIFKIKKLPSVSQAKMLAVAWGTHGGHIPVTKDGYNNPSIMSCIKHGWLVPTGVGGNWPNGNGYENHSVSAEGMLALETFLTDIRYKRLSHDVKET